MFTPPQPPQSNQTPSPSQTNPPQPPSPPPSSPVEDMFATTQPLQRTRPSPFIPKAPSPPQTPLPPKGASPIIEEVDDEHSASKGKGVLLFIGIVLVVGIAVGAGVFFLTRKANQRDGMNVNALLNESQFQGPQENVNVNSDATLNGQQQETVPLTRNVNLEQINVNIPLPEPLDRDKDGLTLEQESALGTSDNLIDTDLDGLSDWDEVKVYRSDPLNPDTDGDGYVDGSEVKKGYSPIIKGQ